MAIKDVQEYYFTMLNQYLEEKQNLEDFEAVLKEGLITEEQFLDAKQNVLSLENNYHRLAYIMFLLNMPKKRSKQKIYVKQYKTILTELKRLGCDLDSIKNENSDSLILLKKALKKLEENK